MPPSAPTQLPAFPARQKRITPQRLLSSNLFPSPTSMRPGTKAAALANHLPGAVIKRRARELRALGERKAAAFRQSQAGRELRVLTLHPSGDSSNNRTPALSSNYLRLFVDGIFPANQWLDVKLAGCEGTFLTGRVSGLGLGPSS